MFREYYRRRSAITRSVWCGAFLVLSLFLAWRLEWLPGSGDSSPVEEELPADAAVADVDPSNSDAEKQTDAVDPSVFSQQGEPGDDFAEPARFRGQAGARPIASASKASGESDDAINGNAPAFLNEYSPKGKSPGTGVRPAGYRGPKQRDPDAPPPMVLSQIDRSIEQREYKEAHKQLSQIYWNKPQWRAAIKTRIEMTAEAIYFKPGYHAMPPYTVKYGDLLQTIAKKYGVTWRYLAMLNELRIVKTKSGQETVNIQPGQRLKVIKGVETKVVDGVRKKVPLFRVSVDLSNRELTLHHSGFFVRKYRIGVGREKRTPIGKFTIQNKVIDPQYTGIDEKTRRRVQIPGKDPRNPLGSHWLEFAPSYGIHGTIDPDSIGKAQSRGCIRMHNSDVEEVYGFVAVGSEVVIRP